MKEDSKEIIKSNMGKSIEEGSLVLYYKSSTVTLHKKAIWSVRSIQFSNNILLENCADSSTDNTFITDISNLINIDYLLEVGDTLDDICTLRSREFYNDYISSYNILTKQPRMITKNKQEKKKMNLDIVDDNVYAAKAAASITAGKTLNKVVLSKVKGQLPIMVRGYADTALGNIIVANLANFVVKNFAEDNEKALYAADAMMAAAMVDFMDQFNFDELLADVLSKVELPKADV